MHDSLEQCRLSQLNVGLRKPVLCKLLWEKEPPRNVQLLIMGVPRQLNDLTPIKEQWRDGVERIGHADEQNLGQVDWNVEVMLLTGHPYRTKNRLKVRGCEEMYVEGHILLQIEDLEQCHGWVTVVVT